MAMFKESLSIDQVIRLVGDIAKCVAKIPDDSKEETGHKEENAQVVATWIPCSQTPPIESNSLSDYLLVKTATDIVVCGYYHEGNHVWYEAHSNIVIPDAKCWLETK